MTICTPSASARRPILARRALIGAIVLIRDLHRLSPAVRTTMSCHTRTVTSTAPMLTVVLRKGMCRVTPHCLLRWVLGVIARPAVLCLFRIMNNSAPVRTSAGAWGKSTCVRTHDKSCRCTYNAGILIGFNRNKSLGLLHRTRVRNRQLCMYAYTTTKSRSVRCSKYYGVVL